MIEAAFFGTLGRDAELKTSKNGKPYVRLKMRVGDGEHAAWIGVTTFDPTAIAAADKLTKGARVYCEGRLSLEEWTTQDGIQNHGLSVMSWHCRLAQIGRHRPKRSNTNGETERSQRTAAQCTFHDDPIPF